MLVLEKEQEKKVELEESYQAPAEASVGGPGVDKAFGAVTDVIARRPRGHRHLSTVTGGPLNVIRSNTCGEQTGVGSHRAVTGKSSKVLSALTFGRDGHCHCEQSVPDNADSFVDGRSAMRRTRKRVGRWATQWMGPGVTCSDMTLYVLYLGSWGALVLPVIPQAANDASAWELGS